MGPIISLCRQDEDQFLKQKKIRPIAESKYQSFSSNTSELMIGINTPKLLLDKNRSSSFLQTEDKTIIDCNNPDNKKSNPLWEKSKLSINDFLILGKLGTGAFGEVLLVKFNQQNYIDKQFNVYYAMKRIKIGWLKNKKLHENIKLEKQILTTFSHPFITELKFSFADNSYLYLIMECAIGGNAFSLIGFNSFSVCTNHRVEEFQKLGQEGIRFVAGCVILALQYLHSQKIIYRDLKPQNVIIFSDGYLKLTDFGLAKYLDHEEDICKTKAGTSSYYSPEMVSGQGYSKMVDFWSLGVFIYELATKELPFKAEDIFNASRFKKRVIEAETNRFWDTKINLSQEIKSLTNGLLKFRPEQRLGRKGWKQIKQHIFFKNLNWQTLQNKKLISPLKLMIEKLPLKFNFVDHLNTYQILIKNRSKYTFDEEWDYNFLKK